MINTSDLKQLAKEQIKGNLFILWVVSMIPFLITGALSFILTIQNVEIGNIIIGNIISSFITPILTIGIVGIYLKLAQEEKPAIGMILDYKNYIWPAFRLSFLMSLRIILWTLLLIIPGIIASFRYSMAYYIYAENPSLSARETLALSKEMTDGYKMSIFMFLLSFIGWVLLGILTCGIAFIWVEPYMNMSMVNLYNELKKNL